MIGKIIDNQEKLPDEFYKCSYEHLWDLYETEDLNKKEIQLDYNKMFFDDEKS